MLDTLKNYSTAFRTAVLHVKILVLFFFLFTGNLYAEEISAPIYMLVDASNGKVLLEKGSNIPISPASLTKLMTLHLSLSDADNGLLSYHHVYDIPVGGDADSMRPGSSLLGLRAGDAATLITLQRAAAMVSANDAAWTLALLSNPNIQDFIQRMNNEAARIGMVHTVYTDPDGWSSLSLTTAEDQMRLVLYYLYNHPGVLPLLHSLPWMIYQEADRLSDKPVKRNTNLLLGRVEGVDGLKTGTIPSAGFHFIATAERNGTRFIALVMGIKTSSYAESLNRRAEDAEILLEWGFSHYHSWRASGIEPVRIKVLHGSQPSVFLKISEEDLESARTATLKNDNENPIVIMVDVPEQLTAPLSPGDVAGFVRWYKGSRLLLELPLRVSESVQRKWKLRDFFNFPFFS